jgi:PAS domain S-box-containing protein
MENTDRQSSHGGDAVRAWYLDGDETARSAVAAYVERERPDVDLVATADLAETVAAVEAGTVDCLVVGRDRPADCRDRLLVDCDVPVILYSSVDPGALDTAELVGIDTFVQRGNGETSREFLAEKIVVQAVADQDMATVALDRAIDRVDRSTDGRTGTFLVYQDGTVVWRSESFESFFPVEAVDGTVPDTADFYARLTALLAEDPASIQAIRRPGGDGESRRFSLPTGEGRGENAHFVYTEYELPEKIAPLTMVVVEDVTAEIMATARTDLFERLVERAQDGLFAVDPDGIIDFCNESFASVLNYESEEIIGEHVSALLADGELERGQAAIQRARNDQAADGSTIDMTFVDSDGAHLELANHFTVLEDDGTYAGMVGVARDVTERRRRERTLERYRTLVESASDPMYVLDADRRIQLVNEAMTTVFGLSHETIVGTRVDDVLPEDAAVSAREATERVRDGDGGEATFDLRFADPDGVDRVFEVTVAPLLEDDAFVGTVSTFRDVTDRERRRSELDLLKEVLTRVLRHNIRSDLSVIKSSAERLADRVDDEERDLALTVVERSDALAETSEKARMIERILGGDDAPSALSLADAVDHGVGVVRHDHDEADYVVDVPDVTVRAHDALPDAIENAVENAVYHAGDAPTVSVTVDVEDDAVALHVADDGPGIPESELAVLERRTETPLEHGSGLGLWLIDWVVDRSGGDLAFDADDGTTVTIRLDRLPDDEA